jgi:hypothetical protein
MTMMVTTHSACAAKPIRPRISAVLKTVIITRLRLVRWPSSSEIRCVSRRPSGVWRVALDGCLTRDDLVVV